jgi:uncharacterized protein YkwD
LTALVVVVLGTGACSGPSGGDAASAPSSTGAGSSAGTTSPAGPGTAPSPTPVAAPTTTKPPAPVHAPAPAQLASQPEVAQQLLAQINAWRADAGQAPLTMTAGLVASAHKHNLVMAAGCGMSHQCPKELAFGDRIKKEGVTFTFAAENIGTGGKVADSTAAILAFAQRLNTGMHDEKPPDDGHRQNMLSPHVKRIGIDVVRDAHGNIWLTQDFAS